MPQIFGVFCGLFISGRSPADEAHNLWPAVDLDKAIMRPVGRWDNDASDWLESEMLYHKLYYVFNYHAYATCDRRPTSDLWSTRALSKRLEFPIRAHLFHAKCLWLANSPMPISISIGEFLLCVTGEIQGSTA